jgi:hypothetical protein
VSSMQEQLFWWLKWSLPSARIEFGNHRRAISTR